MSEREELARLLHRIGEGAEAPNVPKPYWLIADAFLAGEIETSTLRIVES